jgi:hypothetical protein
MLGAGRKAQLRPYRQWKTAYKGSLSTTVLAAKARLSGGRAVVSVRLRARDRDVCSKRVVRQYFRGTVTVAPKRESWVIVRFKIRKTRGKTPRLSKSQCAPPKPRPTPPSSTPPPPPPSNCHPSYPDFCIPPAPPDLDCDDVNGSNFTVIGDDPHGFDGNRDGVGCED